MTLARREREREREREYTIKPKKLLKHAFLTQA